MAGKGRGISISFLADVREFLTGAKKSGEALEGVGDALNDVAREADDSTRVISDEFDRTSREVGRSADRMEDKVAAAFDASTREAREHSREVRRSARQGYDQAGDAAQEFRQEAGQNLSEVASSFNGSMESVVDLVQGTLGGLAVSIPVIGLGLAGLGATVGGLYNYFDGAAEKSEARIAAMFDNMLESGKRYVNDQYVLDELAKIATGDEDARVDYETVLRRGRNTGIDPALIARAYAGEAEALTYIKSELARAQRRIDEAFREAGNDYDQVQQVENQQAALNKLIEDMRRVGVELDSASARVDFFNGAVENMANNVNAQVENLPTDYTLSLNVDADNVADQVERALDRRTFRLNVAAGADGGGGRYGKTVR